MAIPAADILGFCLISSSIFSELFEVFSELPVLFSEPKPTVSILSSELLRDVPELSDFVSELSGLVSELFGLVPELFGLFPQSSCIGIVTKKVRRTSVVSKMVRCEPFSSNFAWISFL